MRSHLFMAVFLLSLAGCGSEGGDTAPKEAAATAGPDATSSRQAAPTPHETVAWLTELTTPRQTGPYAPRDECVDVPDAVQFRRDLAVAVMQRDAQAFAALALPGVKLGFGGEGGREALVEALQADEGRLFEELAQVMKLGCAANSVGGLTMPWYFAQDLEEIDPFTAYLVAGMRIPILNDPDTEAPVRRRLSWEIVEVEPDDSPSPGFRSVRTMDGTIGYVRTESLRSLVDYRLLATREDGAWRISAIVAGD